MTVAEYDQELRGTCGEIERLRAAVWARFAGRGGTADGPRLALALRDLRIAVAGLMAEPILAEWEPPVGG